VTNVSGIVVAHLGDDVTTLEHPVGGRAEPHLRQKQRSVGKENGKIENGDGCGGGEVGCHLGAYPGDDEGRLDIGAPDQAEAPLFRGGIPPQAHRYLVRLAHGLRESAHQPTTKPTTLLALFVVNAKINWKRTKTIIRH
jgi:hypothetical protein